MDTNLKSVLQARELSASELSRRSGVSRGVISRIMNDGSFYSGALVKIAETLGLSVQITFGPDMNIREKEKALEKMEGIAKVIEVPLPTCLGLDNKNEDLKEEKDSDVSFQGGKPGDGCTGKP